MTDIHLIGVNHSTAPLAIREKAAIGRGNLNGALNLLYSLTPYGVILSTCNRTEIYTVSTGSNNAHTTGLSFMKTYLDIPDNTFYQHAYTLTDNTAVEHLFRMASGLDSMIIGEYEILGQVRQALEASKKAQMVNLPLRHIFQSAIRTGRRVREETGISKNALSISSVAVDLASKVVGNLKSSRMLVIGAGEAGRLVAKAARDRGVSQIVIASRTQERASSLTNALGGTAISLNDAMQELCNCNIIVTCADAPHSLLTASQMQAIQRNPELPLVIIDIAVPRNVEPEVAQVKGVFLYNIDDLYRIHRQNRSLRETEINKAENIISEEMTEFCIWWRDYEIRPLVRAMMSKAERIRCSQIKRTINKMPSLSEEDKYHLEKMTKAIITKIFRDPINTIKTNYRQDDNYAKILKELFQLSEVSK
ncbi:MAG: glutamyl-tRNA reductase [Gammaproteobacteria bacterium]|nr:glutamyl-tRNA reductase [Gammaproteobacteria bacterium]